MSAEQTLTTLVLSTNSPSNEIQVSMVATVAGLGSPVIVPVGTVTFFRSVYGIPVALAPPVALVSGSATYAQYFSAGVHTVQAVYTPDSEVLFDPSSSETEVLTVSSLSVQFGIVPGFALVASYSTESDAALPPQLLMQAVPPVLEHSTQIGPNPQSLTLVWTTFNVPQVAIYAGASPLTGIEPTGTSGSFMPPIITATTTYTIYAYDANGNPLLVNSSQLQYSVTVQVL